MLSIRQLNLEGGDSSWKFKNNWPKFYISDQKALLDSDGAVFDCWSFLP